MLSPVRLYVVCNDRAPYLAGWHFLQFFYAVWYLWPSSDNHVKFYGDHLRGTPPSGELNAKGVAKYSDFGRIEGYISETTQDIR